MTSHLRHQIVLDEPMSAHVARHTSSSSLSRHTKKNKMSLTQTYYVASTARSKLGKEAGRADHNLRLLVGHANLLDTLMVELADAEREQEAWFNQSVRKATKTNEPRHIQWVDSIIEESDDESEDGSDAESDDGSDIYDEDAELFNLPLRKLVSPPVTISSEEIFEDFSDSDEEEYMEEDDDFEDDLALERTSKHSPPELLDDLESESDEDSMPSSPETVMFEFDEKRISTATPLYGKTATDAGAFELNKTAAPMIAAC